MGASSRVFRYDAVKVKKPAFQWEKAEGAMEGQEGSGRPGVYIVDDHELVREGLRHLLQDHGIDVVGESGSAREAARRIPAIRPHVAVLDLQLPDGTGIEVCRKVRAVDPGISCLILTGDEDPEARRGAFEAGAAGFLLKQLQSSVLVEAIRRAAVGEVLFDPRTFYRGAPEPEAAHRDPRLRDLTVQERRVLDLLAAGLTNRQISAELSLAEKTVKNYVSSVLAKLGLRSRTQAALYIAHPQRGR